MNENRGANEDARDNAFDWKEWSVFAEGDGVCGELTIDRTFSVGSDFTGVTIDKQQIDKATTVAANFLKDYEASRPPMLITDFHSITDFQLKLYRIHFSLAWKWFGLHLATFLLFVGHFQSILRTSVFYFFTLIVFVSDLYMRSIIKGRSIIAGRNRINQALILYLCILLVQTVAALFMENAETNLFILMAVFFKPVVLFYLSQRARDALEALIRTTKVLSRVVFIEMFLILAFASVACRMFSKYENFYTLGISWLSLFKLSTTTVNPGIWMPMYASSKANSLFFILYMIVTIFYLHSLNLSVVFQVFVKAASDVHQRSSSDREKSIKLAFNALQTVSNQGVPNDVVETMLIRKTIEKMRPRYSRLKINVLMEMVDPMEKKQVQYDLFRTRVRDAMNVSVRVATNPTIYNSAIQKLAAFVTFSNFVYVVLFTSTVGEWNTHLATVVGTIITIIGLVEIALRLSPWSYFPWTKQNVLFDGLAVVGSIVSFYGLVRHIAGDDKGVEWILTGRAVDMLRTMRFFPMFRDIVERSMRVFPVLSGPLIIVLTTIHVFTVIGMMLWGGAVEVDDMAQNDDLLEYYYLLNFNSYIDGLVTVFNILVLNDWIEIAKVFLYADRCSSPAIVYGYFIVLVIVGVNVVLNVITAFFVETFISKVNREDLQNSQLISHKRRDFSIQTLRTRDTMTTKENNPFWGLMDNSDLQALRGIGHTSSSTDTGEVIEFDVYERENYDNIMQNVSSKPTLTPDADVFAKGLRDSLELSGSFSPGWDQIGIMLFVLSSCNQYSSRKFRSLTQEYLSEADFQITISELNNGLSLAAHTTVSQSEKRIMRPIFHPYDSTRVLEVVAMLLPQNQLISFFIIKEKMVPPEPAS